MGFSKCGTAALIVLLCTATTALSAIVTIDVGGSAVNGEWRPTSCTQVQDGVVLTNIVDNVKAIIEGCTITVAAGSDVSKSAVSVSGGLGSGSSVELRSCTVSATFNSATTGIRNRHSAVRIESDATLGQGSSLVISGSAVTVQESGAGHGAAGVLLDTNLVSDGGSFRFLLSESTMTVSCTKVCHGALVLGSTATADDKAMSNFTDHANFTFFKSDVKTTATNDAAHALAFQHRVNFTDFFTLSIVETNLTAESTSECRAIFFNHDAYIGDNGAIVVSSGSSITATAGAGSGPKGLQLTVRIGDHFSLHATDSNFTAVGSGFVNAFLTQSVSGVNTTYALTRSNVRSLGTGGVNVAALWSTGGLGAGGRILLDDSYVSVTGTGVCLSVGLSGWTFGVNSVLSVKSSTIDASGTDSIAAFGWYPGAVFDQGQLLIKDSQLTATSTGSSAAVTLRAPMTASSIQILSSRLEFEAQSSSAPRPGALSVLEGVSWVGVSLTVASSTFTAKSGTTAAASATFISWPATVTGASPQSFDALTFSAPAAASAAAFLVPAGATVGAEATLCLRNVAWSDATEVTAGPAAFATPDVCWASVTVPPTATPALTATHPISNSLPITHSLPLTATPAATKSAAPTASKAPTATPAVSATRSASKARTATPGATMSPAMSTSKAQTATPPVTMSAAPSASKAQTATSPLTLSRPKSLTVSKRATPSRSLPPTPTAVVTSTLPEGATPAPSPAPTPEPTPAPLPAQESSSIETPSPTPGPLVDPSSSSAISPARSSSAIAPASSSAIAPASSSAIAPASSSAIAPASSSAIAPASSSAIAPASSSAISSVVSSSAQEKQSSSAASPSTSSASVQTPGSSSSSAPPPSPAPGLLSGSRSRAASNRDRSSQSDSSRDRSSHSDPTRSDPSRDSGHDPSDSDRDGGTKTDGGTADLSPGGGGASAVVWIAPVVCLIALLAAVCACTLLWLLWRRRQEREEDVKSAAGDVSHDDDHDEAMSSNSLEQDARPAAVSNLVEEPVEEGDKSTVVVVGMNDPFAVEEVSERSMPTAAGSLEENTAAQRKAAVAAAAAAEAQRFAFSRNKAKRG